MRRKGLTSIETKYVQSTGKSGNVTAGPTFPSDGVYNLAEGLVQANFYQYIPKIFASAIAKGTGRGNRIGHKVFLRNFKLRLMITHPLAADSTDEIYVAIVVIRVKQALSQVGSLATSSPLITQVYENITQSTSAPNIPNTATDSRVQFINTWWNFYNSKSKDDYQVLWRTVVKVSNETGSGMEKKMLKKNMRINKPCSWDDNDNEGDGHIYVYWFSDTTNKTAATGVGALPTVFWGYRLTYTDA